MQRWLILLLVLGIAPVLHAEEDDRELVVVVRVEDSTGKPVHRFELHVLRSQGAWAHHARVPSNDGRCELRGGKHALTVVAEQASTREGAPLNLAPSSPRAIERGQRDILLTMPPGRGVQGQVVGIEGGAIAGAKVRAVRAERAPAFDLGAVYTLSTHAVTGPKGRFNLVGLGEGTYFLRTVGPDGQLLGRPSHLRPAVRAVRLRAEPRTGPRVEVVDSAGRPVPGARVRVSSKTIDGRAAFGRLVVDANGHVRLFAPLDDEESQRLIVSPPEGPTGERLARAVAEMPKKGDVRVVLRPGKTLNGQVVDDQGRAAVATVLGGMGIEHTAPDGTFVFRNMAQATFEIGAWPSARYPIDMFGPRGRLVRVAAGATHIRVPLSRVDPADYVRIRLRGPDGEPVARAHVRYGTANQAEPEIIDEAPGRVELELPLSGFTTSKILADGALLRRPEPPYRIMGWHPMDADGTRLPHGRIPVGPLDGSEQEVVLRFSATRTLTGVVRTSAGEPVANAEIRALHEEHGGGRPGGDAQYIKEGEADGAFETALSAEDGSFALASADEFPFWLRVVPPAPHAWTQATRILPDRRHIDVTLPETVTIRVVDGDGTPVSGASVELELLDSISEGGVAGSSYKEYQTDHEGLAYVPRPASELIETFRVSAPENHPLPLATHEVSDWQPESTTVRLLTGVRARVRVRFAPGMSKRHVSVFSRGRSPVDHKWLGYVDKLGRFETPLLPPGSEIFALSRTDEGSHSTPFTAVSATSDPLVLKFPPRDGVLRLRAEGVKPGSVVWIGSEVGIERRWLRIGEGGVAHVRDLPRERFTVFVPGRGNGAPHALATGLRAAAPGKANEQVLASESSVAIKFRIELPPGVEIELAVVEGPGRSLIRAQQAADGAYMVVGLPKGKHPIRVYARKAGSEVPWFARSEAGPDDVPTLTLRPHPSLWMSIWWGG